MAPNEAQTRKHLIDRQIAKAGWNLFDPNQVGFEIPASGDTEDGTPREVAGFFSREDLHNLLYLKQNKTPLAEGLINAEIAGRLYQQEAIRRIATAFEVEKKRRALLVMATGTGKTRTSMGLIDLFLRTNQARRILFLADRDALIDQALTDGFKTHLPNEPNDRIFHVQDRQNQTVVLVYSTRPA